MTQQSLPYRYAHRGDKGTSFYEVSRYEYFGPVLTRLASLDDNTVGEPFQYNAKCAWCWLGYSHSKAVHDRKLAESV